MMKWPQAKDDALLSLSFGDSMVGNLPAWVRHLLWWVVSLGLLAVSYFDRTAVAQSEASWGGLALIAIWGIVGLVFLAIEITIGLKHVPYWQSASRILVSVAFLVGLLALLLNGARAEVFACDQDGCAETPFVTAGAVDAESDLGRASPHDLVLLLAWHAVDVLPALDLADATEWSRPATSVDILARSAAAAVRVFVVVIAIGALTQLWRIVTEQASRSGTRPLTFGDLRAAKAASRVNPTEG